MFFQRGDLLAISGCDPDPGIMEDVALCIALSRLGRVRLVHRFGDLRSADGRLGRAKDQLVWRFASGSAGRWGALTASIATMHVR